MRIICDAADGCGKSSLIEKLCNEYKTDTIHLTKPGCKLPSGYAEKAVLSNIIMDRGFTSEYIYAHYFKRPTLVDKTEFENLLHLYRNTYGWKIIFLCCDPKVAVERINKRGIDKEELTKIQEIDMMYRTIALGYDIPIIDTTDLTPDEVFEKAKEIINESN